LFAGVGNIVTGKPKMGQAKCFLSRWNSKDEKDGVESASLSLGAVFAPQLREACISGGGRRWRERASMRGLEMERGAQGRFWASNDGEISAVQAEWAEGKCARQHEKEKGQKNAKL
jgi:hypothetical protein